MGRNPAAASLSDLSVLADPVRRRLYDYVASQDRPVRREDAAAAAGISRTLAAYHLDRLADAGLLVTSYARPAGRSGPGAGRPAKHYAPAQDEVTVSLPPRNYPLLARLLADAVANDDSGTVRAALMRAAEQEGHAVGARSADLFGTLSELGYQPHRTDAGDIELRNCPFHQLSQRQTELVCKVNHALLRGLHTGRREDPAGLELTPRPGRCCVVIHPSRSRTPGPPAAGAGSRRDGRSTSKTSDH